ncbi:hypothetical protein PM10SUCC1_16910 [Propionigenium maris DSM 9537]|uniref:DUF559 domain-containing protein n=1 Tax=Propionigenium maris DSM 9537 TaxID=1123000 RepID=A0A9W6LN11_9FUSO|nr:endonuclease domain-containing protein [Propionigenium maris]GLI56177.1 hypothetical protein PM10SUCC1_16910 [Propionigenium maris DSM 9537]
MPRKLYDKPSTEEKRRNLKKNQTEAEEMLWNKLRNRQFMGLKFRRQYGVGDYIADFYCPKLKLVIEVDGEIHESIEAREYDRIRDEYFNSLGIKTIRVKNHEVKGDIEGLLTTIILPMVSL